MSYSYSRKAEIDLCNSMEVERYRNSILEDGAQPNTSWSLTQSSNSMELQPAFEQGLWLLSALVFWLAGDAT